MLLKLKKKTRLAIDWTASTLMIIGSLNWGFVALGTNLVEIGFGTGLFTSLVYGLVGLSAVWALFRKFLTGKYFMQ